MSAELLQRARAGDRDAFAALVEPHRGELQVHCYRMLGSLQDAEDALQETLLAAWLGLDGFEGRSSVRTWLYRIATNRCLNLLRSSARRPVTAAPLPVPPPEPTRLGEVLWLQPYPDVLLEGLADQAPGPEARYESREAISLAFVTAVQLLPPNQRAVLLLRDVLGYRARETADLLGLTEDAVTSALKRARADDGCGPRRPPPPAPGGAGGARAARPLRRGLHRARRRRARRADDRRRVGADAAPAVRVPRDRGRAPLLHRDRTRTDSRSPGWCPSGRTASPRGASTSATRSPAACTVVGVLVVGLAGDRICEITHFETALAPYLGLPRTLD